MNWLLLLTLLSSQVTDRTALLPTGVDRGRSRSHQRGPACSLAHLSQLSFMHPAVFRPLRSLHSDAVASLILGDTYVRLPNVGSAELRCLRRGSSRTMQRSIPTAPLGTDVSVVEHVLLPSDRLYLSNCDPSDLA